MANKMINLFLPEEWIEYLDTLVERGEYESRSAAIRYAVKVVHVVRSNKLMRAKTQAR